MSASQNKWNGVERRHNVRFRLLIETLYERIADLELQIAVQAARMDDLERRLLLEQAARQGLAPALLSSQRH